ncbi:MAG: WD40 repeat domain-containing protein [Acidobacteria bacterium]|nr:WD40 repeat domain-containing protein [Acidobacteriota bacterium]
MRPNVKPGVVGLDLSNDGKTLLVAGGDGVIRFVDMTSGRVLRALVGHANAVYLAIFNHDEKLIASSSRDLTARVWDWGSGHELWKASGFRCSVKAVAFSPDSRLLAVAGNDGMLKLYEVKSGKELQSLLHINSATVDMSVYSVAFGRDASKVYAGNGDGTISEWDTASGTETRTWKAHQGNAFKLVFSPDHALLASTGGDGYVKLWDVTTAREVRSLSMTRTPEEAVIVPTALAFSNDGKLLAASSVGLDQKQTTYLFVQTLVWSTKGGEKLFTLEGHKVDVPALIFSKDDRFLLTGGVDTTIKFWDMKTGRLSKTFTLPTNEGVARPGAH